MGAFLAPDTCVEPWPMGLGWSWSHALVLPGRASVAPCGLGEVGGWKRDKLTAHSWTAKTMPGHHSPHMPSTLQFLAEKVREYLMRVEVRACALRVDVVE